MSATKAGGLRAATSTPRSRAVVVALLVLGANTGCSQLAVRKPSDPAFPGSSSGKTGAKVDARSAELPSFVPPPPAPVRTSDRTSTTIPMPVVRNRVKPAVPPHDLEGLLAACRESKIPPPLVHRSTGHSPLPTIAATAPDRARGLAAFQETGIEPPRRLTSPPEVDPVALLEACRLTRIPPPVPSSPTQEIDVVLTACQVAKIPPPIPFASQTRARRVASAVKGTQVPRTLIAREDPSGVLP